MASKIQTSVGIAAPCAAEMSLRRSVDQVSGTIFLTLSQHHAWVVLGGPDADVEAEAAAMDRLAELAVEAAAMLRSPSAPRGAP